jgi:ATP-dependent helicase/nuclease subunit B
MGVARSSSAERSKLSSAPVGERISRNELFARLARGHTERITVVTPNRRLALALTADFDSFQIGKNLPSWEAPDILPFGAFVERVWEEGLYSELGEALPHLLTEPQEQHLWEEILAESGLFAIPQAAAQCREAWRLLHAWAIGPAPGNSEDVAAFKAWSKEYERRTKADIDAARLPDLLVPLLPKLKAPKRLVAYAFELLPPQTKAFLSHFEVLVCEPEPAQATAIRTSYLSPQLEIEAAAKWARARLEEGRTRIAVVVPALPQRRKEVLRVFSRVMGSRLAFNVSIGEPLSACPPVDFALALLEVCVREIPFSKASALIRSPFLGGAESEMARRAALDARLRRDADASLGLPKLVAAAESCPLLRERLEALFAVPTCAAQTPHEWARHFSALLAAAGFPGERAPDSGEFQALAKWHEALAEFAKLQRVAGRLSSGAAFSSLRRLCGETLFQPETHEAPVQILGVLESAGLRFEGLWVSGLTDEAWPLRARPNPFIPLALQKAAGVPQASAEASLEFDRRLTTQWRGAASEVVFSYALKDKDRDLAPSPLILDVPHSPLALPEPPRYRDRVFASRKTEPVADHSAPRVPPGKVRGGTRVLADQAACPFRAFAKWRLGAKPLEEPSAGLDARERGSLLHAMMKFLWSELKGSASLARDLEPAIGRAAGAAIRELGLEGRFAELERERLERLAAEWLELERTRSAFEVVAVEEPRTITVAGLELSGRIDRMDRLGEGEHVLIDYKTGGNPSPKLWEGPRPDEPQLPLYALAAPERLAAIAFAKVKPGEMRFTGWAKEKGLLPKVNEAKSWPDLLAAWRRDAESLGAAFAAGEARVDPKNDLKTCRLCELQTLCRVNEK